MDKAKWTVVLFGSIFSICTLLSIFSFLLVYSTAKQCELQMQNAEDFLQSVNEQVDRIELSIIANKEEAPTNDESVETDILYERFLIREVNEKIGVYTEEGYLIRTLPVNVQTLPESDRIALQTGIEVNSWRELIALIQDYEG